MTRKRDKLSKTNNTRKPEPVDSAQLPEPEGVTSEPEHARDFRIDIAGIHYGLDSDEIDALEREYAAKGKPLVTLEDYRRAFGASRWG